MKWLVVFTATVIYDWLWAKYTLAVSAKKPALASGTSALIFLAGGSVIVEYTRDPWLLLPACAGAALGTYLALQ